MIYQIIEKESSSGFSIEDVCQTLDVSLSGYYAWDGRGPSEREKTNGKILKVMNDSYTKHEGMIRIDKL
ncbi:MAG: hypothetical protein GX115_10240 [Ruminiclostridium sp.]|nr:hypothetical protein [Ruminiclostridium sp.]